MKYGIAFFATAFMFTLSLTMVYGQNSLLKTGISAPEWELTNADSQVRKLSDFKGKIVIMDFWATWCAPCVAYQPRLQSIHENYSDKDVVVLGMDCNETQRVDFAAYKKRKKISYEIIQNSEKIGDTYKVQGIPVLYVIDRSGKIIHASLGYSEKAEAKLISVIEKAIKTR